MEKLGGYPHYSLEPFMPQFILQHNKIAQAAVES